MTTINRSITKTAIESALTGQISSHTHEGGSLTLSEVKADADISDAISKKHGNTLDHAAGSDNQDLSGLEPKQTGKSLSTNDLTAELKSGYDGAVSHAGSSHAPSGAQTNADITKAEIEAKLTGEISSHTHAGGGGPAFPIGSVFISVVSTDPATLLGYGTWAAIGAGKVLVGLDSGDADFDTAEETGGAKTVTSTGSVSTPTITVDALSGGGRKGGTTNPASIIENGNIPTASASAPTYTGNATSVVQPYIVAHFWKRTA